MAPQAPYTNSSSNIKSQYPLTAEDEEEAVTSLCNLISYPTVSATSAVTGAYVDCANYIIEELNKVPCFSDVHILEESPDHSPVVLACWKGEDGSDELPIVLLNSHYDVVPAEKEDWTVEPFKGFLSEEDGKIYGRGAQDMKCVCVQYIYAIKILARNGFRPKRSVYLSFVPDEEIGGGGMAALLDSAWYKNLPNGIAVALDEGLANEGDVYSVFYGERLPWWVDVTAYGNTGHGSRFIEATAVEQLLALTNKALEFRKKQKDILFGEGKHAGCSHSVAKKLGDVTTLNITTLEAGVRVADTYAYNCCPPVAKCSFDIRISPHMDPKDMKSLLDGWCKECSAPGVGGLKWRFLKSEGNSSMEHATTSIEKSSNPWYNIFSEAINALGIDVVPEVFPAATDSRFLRALGVRALGFSPMRNSEIMLHENDEYILKSVFVEGISSYVAVINALASQGKDIDEQCK